jgi:hypothetical protein
MKTLGGVAHIIGDNFRGYHPAYAPLMRQDDKMAAFYTDRDTGRWVEKAIAHAICERVNIIIEGTMRDSTKVEETMKNLRQAGYQVDARVLVVKSELSWQGIIQRYEAQKADRGAGRMTTPTSHQASYDGVPITVAHIEQEKLADTLTLYRRGNVVIYQNELNDGDWINPPIAQYMIELERKRALTEQEARDYLNGYEHILTQITLPERQASIDEINTIRQFCEQARQQVLKIRA